MQHEISRRQLLGQGARVGLGLGGLSLLGGPLAGCAEDGAGGGGDELVVAAIVSTTGANAGFGQGTWHGIQTATRLINEQGGIKALGGAKLKAALYDTQSKPDVAASQAAKAVRDRAVAVVGCNQSAASLIVSQICERSSVPFITSTDFDPELTERGFKFMFQTTPFLQVHAENMLTLCRQLGQESGKPARRLGILCDDTVIGKSAKGVLESAGRELGYEIAQSQSFEVTTTDFSSFVAKMKSAGVELLLGFQTPEPAIQIVKTMREQRFEPLGFGGLLGGQVTGEYLQELGADADYTLSSSPWSADLKIPGMKDVLDAFEQEFKEPVDSVRASGFCSMAVVWEGLEQAASDEPPKLRDAMTKIDLDPGKRAYIQIDGCRFDGHGYNAEAAVAIKQTKDGEQYAIAPERYASETKPVWPKPPWS